ncbi:hypothetical protein DG474_03995 [Streptococcus oralis]|nr:hypothetical protein DG474_03995 [Streptococcus oralis]
MSKQSKEIEDRMGKLSTRGLPILFLKRSLYSMKIKEQTRKLAAGCSKQCFEVADVSCRGLKRFSKSIS